MLRDMLSSFQNQSTIWANPFRNRDAHSGVDFFVGFLGGKEINQRLNYNIAHREFAIRFTSKKHAKIVLRFEQPDTRLMLKWSDFRFGLFVRCEFREFIQASGDVKSIRLREHQPREHRHRLHLHSIGHGCHQCSLLTELYQTIECGESRSSSGFLQLRWLDAGWML